MLAPAIWAIGDDAAMREVREPETKADRRPCIDSHQAKYDERKDHAQNRITLQRTRPVKIGAVGKIIRADQTPERLIANDRRNPAGPCRLGAADMAVEQADGQRITDNDHADIDEDQNVPRSTASDQPSISAPTCQYPSRGSFIRPSTQKK